jgi:hypothetical protein
MAKRGGRGHDINGARATSEGECALLCPACPQPEKNLPPDWQEAGPERRFAFLAIEV